MLRRRDGGAVQTESVKEEGSAPLRKGTSPEGAMASADMRVRRMRPDERPWLLRLWERSVRATHTFLAESDIDDLRPQVAEVLASDAVAWWVLASPGDMPIGFLGFVAPGIEALFIDPDHFRRGAGRRLVAHAQALARRTLTVDVNEQNPGAVRFYEALGFRVIGRSPTDSSGRPFPLLHMKGPEPAGREGPKTDAGQA